MPSFFIKMKHPSFCGQHANQNAEWIWIVEVNLFAIFNPVAQYQ